MAITIDGIPVSGSQGYTTWSRNRFGAYKRNRTKPVNPNSGNQVAIRNAFRGAVTSWTDILTSVQRSSWETYAANVPWLNAAGQSVRMTGQNAYVRAETFFQFWGGVAAPTTAPALFSTGAFNPTLTSVSYDVSANTLTVTVGAPLATNSFQSAGGYIGARVSIPANPSVNFPPNRFTQIGFVGPIGIATDPVVFGPSTSPYVYQALQRVWVAVRATTADAMVSNEVLLGPVTVTVVP